MIARAFDRHGIGMLAGAVLVSLAMSCGGVDGPTDPADGAPTLTEIAPGSGIAGQSATTVRVALTGTGFDGSDLEVNVGGSRVEVGNVTVHGPTSLTAEFIIVGGAPTGARDVRVSTDAGTSGSMTFTVQRDRANGNGDGGPMIEIYDNYHSPMYIEVAVGAPVLWKNVGSNDHSVSRYGPYEWEDQLLHPSQTFQHTFEEAGEYSFICVFHQKVNTVKVVDSMPMMMMMDPASTAE